MYDALVSSLRRITWLCLVTLLFAGCSGPASEQAETIRMTVPTDQQLKDALDEVLRFTYEMRSLNTSDHAAWQILHGVLTYQQDFQIRHSDGEVSAVEHLLEGGTMNGWTFESGHLGPRAVLEAGSNTGQGHADQWLAVMAQCELVADRAIKIGSRAYTMRDWILQVQHDVPRNVLQEYSWTLIGLTLYLPTSAMWKAEDAQLWSIERLVDIETQHELHTSACGGTHRMIGISMALNQYLAQQEESTELTGVWKAADDKIQEAIAVARRYQNPDGGFSSHYFARPGTTPDLSTALGTTGHTLEFLTVALPTEQLDDLWVKRAVWYLCEVFRKTQDYDLECGALYHAAHGLSLYRQRQFGESTKDQLQVAGGD